MIQLSVFILTCLTVTKLVIAAYNVYTSFVPEK